MATQGDDCYFFYYSTCAKGTSCPFRHCEEALGNEVVCSLWQEGRCYRPVCQYRHMEIEKNRSTIACYWENMPGGCSKPHCAFQHYRSTDKASTINPRVVSLSIKKNLKVLPVEVSEDSMSNLSLLRIKQASIESELQIPSPKIDPIVVNPLEDESDQESCNGSPAKKQHIERLQEVQLAGRQTVVSTSKHKEQNEPNIQIGIKSLEEIRKEKLASAKRLIAEAKYLTEEDYEDVNEGMTPSTSSRSAEEIQREKALRSLGKFSNGKVVAKRSSIDVQKDFVVRRVVLANESRDSENIAMEKNLPTSAVRVADRLGVRRVVQTSDNTKQTGSDMKVKSIACRLGTIDENNDAKGKAIKSRLGIAKDENNDVKVKAIKSRLGITKEENEVGESGSSVKSRLGLKRPIDAANSENSAKREALYIDDKAPVAVKSWTEIRQEKQAKTDTSGTIKVKTLEEIRREKAARLQKEQNKNPSEVASTDEVEAKKVTSIRTMKVLQPKKTSDTVPAVKSQTDIDDKDSLSKIAVKSLSEIRREKQRRIQATSPESDPSVTVKTLEQIKHEKSAKQETENSSARSPRKLLRKVTSSEDIASDSADSTKQTLHVATPGEERTNSARKLKRPVTSSPERTVTTKRTVKRTVKLYQPPAVKQQEAERKKLGDKQPAGKDVTVKSPKKPDWGVKTFSEILREKQLSKQQQNQQKEKSERSFSPIVFSKDKSEPQVKPTSVVNPVVTHVRPLMNPRRRTLSKRGTAEEASDSSDSSSQEEEAATVASHVEDEPVTATSRLEDEPEEPAAVTSHVDENVSSTEEQAVTSSTVTVTSSQHDDHESEEVIESDNTQKPVTSSVGANVTDGAPSPQNTDVSSNTDIDIDTSTVLSDAAESTEPVIVTAQAEPTEKLPASVAVSAESLPLPRRPTETKRKVSTSSSVRSEERPAKVSRLDSTFDEDLDALLGDMSDDRDAVDGERTADDSDLLLEMEELLA